MADLRAKRLFLLLLSLLPLPLAAQVSNSTSFASEEVRSAVAARYAIEDRLRLDGFADAEVAIYLEYLSELELQPLNINKVTSEELRRLPFLDDFFIRNFIQYRLQHGSFYSLYELKQVPGAIPSDLEMLEPFLSVERERHEDEGVDFQMFAGADFPIQDRNKTEHTPMKEAMQEKNSVKLRRGKSWRAAWHAAKGARERWLPVKEGVWDYHSGYVMREREERIVQRFLLGDYRLSFGQGLLHGMGISYFSKSDATIRYGTSGQKGFSPHNSYREWGFFRGAVAQLSFGEVSLTPFVAYTPIDARVSDDGGRLKTIYTDGVHDSPLRLESRHAARLETVGGYLEYNSPMGVMTHHFHLGMQAVTQRFMYDGREILPPEKYLQQGRVTRLAVDWTYSFRSGRVAGEALLPVRGERESGAMVAHAALVDDYLGTFIVQGRYLGSKYLHPHAGTYAYFASGTNEKGGRISWNGELPLGWMGSVTGDFYASVEPSERRRSNEGVVITSRLRKDFRDGNAILQARWRKSDAGKRLSLQGYMEWKVGGEATVSPRFQIVMADHQQRGYAIGVKASALLGQKGGYKLSGQYFSSPTFATAIRSIENSSPHRYYVPMLYGKGGRLSALLSYSPTSQATFYLKGTYTHYAEQPSGTPLRPSIELSTMLKL